MKAHSKKARNRVQAAEIPVNDAPSNVKGDRFAVALFVALVCAAAALLVGGAYWSISGLLAALHPPINWGSCVLLSSTLVISVLAARALASMSIFGPIMLGTRMGAWKSLEGFARKGMPFSRLYPGGSIWLSTALVQSLVNRGHYDDAMAAADAEWNRSGKDERQAQNLGTLCFAAGIAKQAQGDFKQAQMWNERALGVLNTSLEQLLKPAKGIMAKIASPQSGQMIGQLRMQLAAAYFNNATIYFNNMDYRRAKENYRSAVENAVKAPDFPQKPEIIKFGNEQLSRLKHN
jgi:tetratricopeptide (TPR) repeat protein